MKWKILLILVLASSSLHLQAQQRTYKLNQFSFEDTAGKKYNLDSLKGKVVYVDCWFPSCPPCRAEMPYSQMLQQRLHTMQMDSNIVFITISFKQSTEEWKTALSKLPMPKAIHLYSPASTYEIAMAGGNYPTYRIFNTKGDLDIENASRPSEFLKTDFVLYAVGKGETITNALKIFDAEKNVAKEKIKNALLKNFFTIEMKYDKEFVDAFLKLGVK
jgi:thiol-disulfide isomerase/thioredoxin